MSDPIHSSNNNQISFEIPQGFTLLNTFQSGVAGPLTTIALSPDGKTIASGLVDKTIRLWDSASGKLQQTLGNSVSKSSGSGSAGIITATVGHGKVFLRR